MLGEAFYKQFSKDYNLKCTDIDLNEKWISYLDFRDRSDYFNDVLKFKPDFLFTWEHSLILNFVKKM